MRVLTVNVGSSSLKLAVFDDEELVGDLTLQGSDGDLEDEAIGELVTTFGPIDAVGHRIVHGGSEFTGPVLVDDHVRQTLANLVDLAPLHLPPSLAGLDTMTRLLPRAFQVACFDTSFHTDMPAAAATYALPYEWRIRWALRRYGFHGLSHAYAFSRTSELYGDRDHQGELRVVSCHLGSGASLTAIKGGRSLDTTMGFTPLEGLVMSTRSGSIDPGLVLWLEEHVGLPPAELASTLEHRSGLLGLCGHGDMRAVLAAERSGDERAHIAIEVYLHRLRAEISAMTAAMDGLDALSFTGGVGESAPAIRARALDGLSFLGVTIDHRLNETALPDVEISGVSPVRSFVIRAREDLQIAREVHHVFLHHAGRAK